MTERLTDDEKELLLKLGDRLCGNGGFYSETEGRVLRATLSRLDALEREATAAHKGLDAAGVASNDLCFRIGLLVARVCDREAALAAKDLQIDYWQQQLSEARAAQTRLADIVIEDAESDLTKARAERSTLHDELNEYVKAQEEMRAERDRLREEIEGKGGYKDVIVMLRQGEARLSTQLSEAQAALRDQPEESRAWALMNAFASGDTQKEWVRVEPQAVLGEVYGLFASARQRRLAALKSAPESLQQKPEDVKAWAEAAAEDWVSQPDPVDATTSPVKAAPEEE